MLQASWASVLEAVPWASVPWASRASVLQVVLQAVLQAAVLQAAVPQASASGIRRHPERADARAQIRSCQL